MKNILAGLLVLVLVLAAVQWLRPVPEPTLAAAPPSVPGGSAPIRWPSGGEAALAVPGVGTIGVFGEQQPVPIASVAKIMTAVLVLQAHPLALGQQGPTLTVSAADAATYQQDTSQQQSTAKVVAGEKLTEYQMLQALLIPSANNVATMLAQWVAGSESRFVSMMNQKARALGMTHTRYTDPSGLHPGTVSTAVDQLKIAEVAMRSPVFHEIVSMPQAQLPVAGTVYNVNYVLGQEGIDGIKTGSTNQAGGCFVFSAYRTVGGRQLMVLGAVLGQQKAPIIWAALDAGKALLKSASSALKMVSVVSSGEQVGFVRSAWAAAVPVVTAKGAAVPGWKGLPVRTRVIVSPLASTLASGSRVGTMVVSAGQQVLRIPLVTTAPLSAPGPRWRLTRL